MSHVSAAPRVRFREYETIYLMRPDVSKEAAGRVAQRVDEALKREGGTLVAVETWGRRQTAFAVGRFKRAVYVYLKYVGKSTLVAELERNLRMQDDVIKYQTIILNSDVDLAALTVDPEVAKFEELDLPEDVEDDKALERALGFIEPESPPRRERSDIDDEMASDEMNLNADLRDGEELP